MTFTPLSPSLRGSALRSLTTLACVSLMISACFTAPKLKDSVHSEQFVDDGIDYYSSDLDGDLTFKRIENQWHEDEEGNRIYHVNRVVTPRGDTLFYVGDYEERERQNAILEREGRDSLDRVSRFRYMSPNRTPTRVRVIDSFDDDPDQLPDPDSGMSTDNPDGATPAQPPRGRSLDLDNRGTPQAGNQPQRSRVRSSGSPSSQPRSSQSSGRASDRSNSRRPKETD